MRHGLSCGRHRVRSQGLHLFGQGGVVLPQLLNTTLVVTALLIQNIQLMADFVVLFLHLRRRHLHFRGGMLTNFVIKGRVHHPGHIRYRLLLCGRSVATHVDVRQVKASANGSGSPHRNNPQPDVLFTLYNRIDARHQLPSPSRMTYTSIRAPASIWLTGWLNITARVPGCQKSLSLMFRADGVLFSTANRTSFR
ncbi:Uncharacterised protein [Salmonella enterica subsp. enterica serovar Pullorum]|nr:hypothetical protein SPFCAV_04545 [Salmonella enterica subsp. enterica serovar Gallinarum/Pullorum str. FCAV198]CZQ35002.1 Uncharacterised protein [Salmonella enterica subsp. enterica serovar Pullorum]